MNTYFTSSQRVLNLGWLSLKVASLKYFTSLLISEICVSVTIHYRVLAECFVLFDYYEGDLNNWFSHCCPASEILFNRSNLSLSKVRFVNLIRPKKTFKKDWVMLCALDT